MYSDSKNQLQWHIDNCSGPSFCGCGGGCLKSLPLSSSWFVAVNMRVHKTRHHQKISSFHQLTLRFLLRQTLGIGSVWKNIALKKNDFFLIELLWYISLWLLLLLRMEFKLVWFSYKLVNSDINVILHSFVGSGIDL